MAIHIEHERLTEYMNHWGYYYANHGASENNATISFKDEKGEIHLVPVYWEDICFDQDGQLSAVFGCAPKEVEMKIYLNEDPNINCSNFTYDDTADEFLTDISLNELIKVNKKLKI